MSPSPLDPVQRADPRTTHGSAPPMAGEERTDGRTATQREHDDNYAVSAPALSVRTTIPPSGTVPLNAWDAANYAGFTNAACLCQPRQPSVSRGGAMSREQRGPNEKLGAVLALAGISNAGLARRVNDLGAQRGLTLRYDKTSVARWVSKGMVPQGAAPHLIAAAIGAEARPPGAAARDRPGGRGSRPRGGPRLPARRRTRRCARPPSCTASTSPAAARAPAASGSRWPDRSR